MSARTFTLQINEYDGTPNYNMGYNTFGQTWRTGRGRVFQDEFHPEWGTVGVTTVKEGREEEAKMNLKSVSQQGGTWEGLQYVARAWWVELPQHSQHVCFVCPPVSCQVPSVFYLLGRVRCRVLCVNLFSTSTKKLAIRTYSRGVQGCFRNSQLFRIPTRFDGHLASRGDGRTSHSSLHLPFSPGRREGEWEVEGKIVGETLDGEEGPRRGRVVVLWLVWG